MFCDVAGIFILVQEKTEVNIEVTLPNERMVEEIRKV